MKPSQHLVLSVASGGVGWAATGEWGAVPIAVAAGTLVDVDHIPDYVWNFVLGRTPVMTLVFHAWEWPCGLLVLGGWTGFSWWLTAAVVAYGLHLTVDALFNNVDFTRYSIVFRALSGFRRAKLTPQWTAQKSREEINVEAPAVAAVVDWLQGLTGRPIGDRRVDGVWGHLEKREITSQKTGQGSKRRRPGSKREIPDE